VSIGQDQDWIVCNIFAIFFDIFDFFIGFGSVLLKKIGSGQHVLFNFYWFV